MQGSFHKGKLRTVVTISQENGIIGVLKDILSSDRQRKVNRQTRRTAHGKIQSCKEKSFL